MADIYLVQGPRCLSWYQECLSRLKDSHNKDKTVSYYAIFMMGIIILVRHHLYTEAAPRSQWVKFWQKCRPNFNSTRKKTQEKLPTTPTPPHALLPFASHLRHQSYITSEEGDLRVCWRSEERSSEAVKRGSQQTKHQSSTQGTTQGVYCNNKMILSLRLLRARCKNN